MAGKELGLVLQLYGHVIIAACFLWSASSSQENLETEQRPATRRLEDIVFNDMLKIVDNKFDTLTTRITALETAINSLQFYSMRNFRQITGSLQSTNTELQTVRKQVTQLEEYGREENTFVSLLAGDVSDLKKSTSDLLSEFESSMFYVNENLEKQGKTVKSVLEDTVVSTVLESSQQLSKRMEEIIQQQEISKTQPVSCSVDFSSISEHIDLRFAEFKMQTHSHFVKLIHAAKLDMRKGKRNIDGESGNNKSHQINQETSCDCKHEVDKESKDPIDDAPRNELPSHGIENMEQQISPDVDRKYQNENDEQVMNALYNMTTSVLQAVSYFRNTGQLLEHILSNTDSLAMQQTDLNKRFASLQVGDQMSTHDEESLQSNMIPGADNVREYSDNGMSRVKAAERGCVLPADMFSNLATIIKNGSQLLEVLTDLAQLSSVSLSTSTAALHDQVIKIEGIITQMATMLLTTADLEESDPFNVLANATQKVLRLLETVVSNTGWLPQIFPSIQQLEALANRSMHTAMQNQVLLRRAQQPLTTQESSSNTNEGEDSSTTSNMFSRIHGHEDKSSHGEESLSSKDEATLNKDFLEVTYGTSLQLNRIMHALTKLLSEPDPLISLVEGGKPDQGRVEIFYNGLWGALCHSDLSHTEADLICRHLGFKGGISAGAGHFGPGSGVTWTFNASCLANSQCPVVTYSEATAQCSHDLDAGVICDHMLRIVSADGSTKGQVGRLEIHHRGMWLPICGEGWSGYSARVACQQMGFSDGREMQASEWLEGANSTWLSNVACTGHETRLDACQTKGWRQPCPGLIPASVRCV